MCRCLVGWSALDLGSLVYASGVSRRGEDASTLTAYLREIAKLPRLSVDEERALGARIKDGRDDEAVTRLVEANLRFVVSCARRYRGLGVGKALLAETCPEGEWTYTCRTGASAGFLGARFHWNPVSARVK